MRETSRPGLTSSHHHLSAPHKSPRQDAPSQTSSTCITGNSTSPAFPFSTPTRPPAPPELHRPPNPPRQPTPRQWSRRNVGFPAGGPAPTGGPSSRCRGNHTSPLVFLHHEPESRQRRPLSRLFSQGVPNEQTRSAARTMNQMPIRTKHPPNGRRHSFPPSPRRASSPGSIHPSHLRDRSHRSSSAWPD